MVVDRPISLRLGGLLLKLSIMELRVATLLRQGVDLLKRSLSHAPYREADFVGTDKARRKVAALALRIAFTQARLGRDASPELRTAVSIDPTWPVTHRRLGTALAKLNNHHEATLAFRRAISLGQANDPEMLTELGESYFRTGHLPLAVDALTDALRLDPKCYEAFCAFQRIAFEVYSKGDLFTALKIFRACDATGTNQRMVRFYQDCDETPSQTAMDAYLSTLEKAWQDYDQGKAVMPRAHRDMLADSGALDAIEAFRKEERRVLIISSKYIAHSEKYLLHDLTIAYQESAKAAGLDYEIVYCDALHHGLEKSVAVAREIEDKIASFRPDIVFFDANINVPAMQRLGIAFPLNEGFVTELKRKYGCAFVGVLSDAYGKIGGEIARYWHPNLDLVVSYEPPPVTGEDAFQSLVLPVPVPKSHFYSHRLSRRREEICFIGTTFKYMRAETLAMLEEADIPLYVRGGDRTADCPDLEEYADRMRHSRAVLNISARDIDLPDNEDLDCITARVYEAINAGALLLEQDNRSTPYFFAPYVHYLPFRSMGELKMVARMVLSNPKIWEEVNKRAVPFADMYSDDMFWGRIIKRLALQDRRRAQV